LQTTLYGEQRRLKEAVEVLREGIDNNPSSYRIFSSYGIFLTKIGQYDTAIEIFEKGLAIIDYDPDLWNYLGVVYWRKGDFEKALEAYQKALSLDNNYPKIFNNLGSLYLSLFLKTKSRFGLQWARGCLQTCWQYKWSDFLLGKGLGAQTGFRLCSL